MRTHFHSWVLSLCTLHCVRSQFPLTDLGCAYNQPIACPYGYTRDQNGCTTCLNFDTSSQTAGANPGGDPFHQGGAQITLSGVTPASQLGYSKEFTTPCVPGTTCDLQCDYGFETGPMDMCQYCICAVPGASGYKTPCADAPLTCDLACTEGYVTGQDGCQYCKCNNTTTVAPPAKATSISAEECTMKITSCQIRFPFGFMTDDECETCIGKDEIYAVGLIPEERQPVIQLSNPCIQGFDRCMIFCRTGYRTGPKHCQYCACNN